MTTGHVLSGPAVSSFVQAPRVDSRAAAAEALRAFLRCVVFRAWGDEAPDREFSFTSVESVWPEPSQPLAVPIAVVLDPSEGKQSAWSLTPSPLEETRDVFAPGTVLWKTAELVADLQLDVWCGNEPEREAVAARLPSLFSPGEDQFGVFVEGPPTYFSQPVRLTLMSMQRMDTEGSIYPRERRLMCSIRAEVAEVHLRGSVSTTIRVGVSGDENPIEEDP